MKNKTLILARLLAIACIGLLAGCGESKDIHKKIIPIITLHHTTLPPGWSVVTDGAVYGIKDSDGFISDRFTYANRQEAVDHAWRQFEFETEGKNEPKPTRHNWKEESR